MSTTERLVGVLRVLLGCAFAVLVAAQVAFLPEMYADYVDGAPERAGSQWLLAVAVLELLCVQVVIVCTWRLLAMVREDRIFSEASLVWVNAIVAAMAAAWLLLLGTLVHVARPGGPPGPSVGLLLLMLVVGAVVGLLMVVMRALLRQATSLRTEMEAVV